MFDLDPILQWINDKADAVFETWDNQLFDLPTAIANQIPVPDFLLNMGTFTMPPAVSYYAVIFEMPFGFTVIVSALIARFAVRRMPFLG